MEKLEVKSAIALFCNGFDGILAKVDSLARQKFQAQHVDLIAYYPRSTRKFQVHSPFESEVLKQQPTASLVRNGRECLALIKKPYAHLIVPRDLGANRTLLVLAIAVLTRAAIVELDLINSQFTPRWKLGYFGSLLRRGFTRRTWNRLLLSLSARFKLPRLLGYPVNMHLETVAVCNLRCPACATGLNALGRAQGFMDLTKYQSMMAECGPYLNNLVLHMYGEPLLHKQIIDFIKTAKAKQIRHVELSTNGNITWSDEYARAFVQSGLDHMIISIDGADEPTYQIYRKGGKLSTVNEFLKTIVRAKQATGALTPIIEVQFIIMKHNVQQVEQARELFLSLGADSFRSKMFDATFAEIGLDAALALMPEADADTFYRMENGQLVSKFATDKNFCPIVWDTASLTWDGHMIPCCFDEKGSVVLGDIFHIANRFWDVWNSDKYVGFRKAILTARKKIPLCKDCPYV